MNLYCCCCMMLLSICMYVMCVVQMAVLFDCMYVVWCRLSQHGQEQSDQQSQAYQGVWRGGCAGSYQVRYDVVRPSCYHVFGFVSQKQSTATKSPLLALVFNLTKLSLSGASQK